MEAKKDIVSKANKNVDIIELTKKLEKFEGSISQIKRILCTHGFETANTNQEIN